MLDVMGTTVLLYFCMLMILFCWHHLFMHSSCWLTFVTGNFLDMAINAKKSSCALDRDTKAFVLMSQCRVL